MGATWKAGGTGPMPGRIYFPDGNSWAHVETAGATVEGSGAPANMPPAGGESTKTILYAALFALLVLLIAAALQARRPGEHESRRRRWLARGERRRPGHERQQHEHT